MLIQSIYIYFKAKKFLKILNTFSEQYHIATNEYSKLRLRYSNIGRIQTAIKDIMKENNPRYNELISKIAKRIPFMINASKVLEINIHYSYINGRTIVDINIFEDLIQPNTFTKIPDDTALITTNKIIGAAKDSIIASIANILNPINWPKLLKQILVKIIDSLRNS